MDKPQNTDETMSITTENTFETALVQSLIDQGGYTLGNASDYSKELGLFKNEVVEFLKTSQPKRWEKIAAIHTNDRNTIILCYITNYRSKHAQI